METLIALADLARQLGPVFRWICGGAFVAALIFGRAYGEQMPIGAGFALTWLLIIANGG